MAAWSRRNASSTKSGAECRSRTRRSRSASRRCVGNSATMRRGRVSLRPCRSMAIGSLPKWTVNLLIGHSPGDITGPLEGLLLGGAIGLGVWISDRLAVADRVRRSALLAAGLGGAAGILITLLRGRMMGGSLLALEESFGGSRLRLDRIGSLFGERGLGPARQTVTAAD